MGLEDRLDNPIGTLSGGQRQALTLLMATWLRPKLLLLDEHKAALDPKSADHVIRVTEACTRYPPLARALSELLKHSHLVRKRSNADPSLMEAAGENCVVRRRREEAGLATHLTADVQVTPGQAKQRIGHDFSLVRRMNVDKLATTLVHRPTSDAAMKGNAYRWREIVHALVFSGLGHVGCA